MNDDKFFQNVFGNVPVMGIFRSQGLERTLRLAHAAWDAGVQTMEVTVQNAEDVPVLAAVADLARDRGLRVGAGTITSVEQLDAVARAGASFTVAPGFDPDITDASRRHGMPHIPGVATGTEIQATLRHGLTWLKAFPAERLGPEWITHQRGPFPQVRFVATGGVAAETASQFLDAGCRVVALGSAFADEQQIEKIGELLRARADGASQ